MCRDEVPKEIDEVKRLEFIEHGNALLLSGFFVSGRCVLVLRLESEWGRKMKRPSLSV